MNGDGVDRQKCTALFMNVGNCCYQIRFTTASVYVRVARHVTVIVGLPRLLALPL